MFAQVERCHYEKSPLGEVICQLRFPAILTIGAVPPAEFQEAIRASFPDYSQRQETPVAVPGAPQAPAVTNYRFASADGQWRVNLTSQFISLACTNYTTWEAFARKLDQPLAAFIRIYHPAYFERVGLRYLNFISRKSLELEGVPFRELVQSRYLGVLGEEDLLEGAVSRSMVDAELSAPNGCRVRIHAGPGVVRRGNVPDRELKFIFDQDLFVPGRVAVNQCAPVLERLHASANAVFRGAILPRLHEAMI